MNLHFFVVLLLAATLSAEDNPSRKTNQTPVIKVSPFTTTPPLPDQKIGAAILTVISRCDCVVIKSGSGKEDPTTTLKDRPLINKFGQLLFQTNYQKKPICLCVSYPTFCFYRGETFEMEISFPHGNKIRAYGDMVSGDYEISEATVKELVSLMKVE